MSTPERVSGIERDFFSSCPCGTRRVVIKIDLPIAEQILVPLGVHCTILRPGEARMTFNSEQAACLSGCSRRQLRYWKKTGIMQPAEVEFSPGGARRDRYDFRNLVELRTIVAMQQRGISLQKIRKTLQYLREHTDCSRPLAGCKLVTDGSTIFEICEDASSILDTLRRGQVAFCIAVDGIAEELSARLLEMARDREDFLCRLMA